MPAGPSTSEAGHEELSEHLFSRGQLRSTPQTLPIPSTVPNAAGGHAFAVDDWTRLDRFLILGSEGGSYYAGERVADARERAGGAARHPGGWRAGRGAHRRRQRGGPCAEERSGPVRARLGGLGRRSGDAARGLWRRCPRWPARARICSSSPSFVQGTRGWGRALRRAVGGWYLAQPVDRLAYQLVKYRQRDGWSHRDLLRLAHPETAEPDRKALLDWVCRGTASEALPSLVQAAIALGKAVDGGEAAALIRAHDLPREAVPTELLNDPAVWEALLARMPLTALVRSLAKLTAVGVIKPLGDQLPLVLSALGDVDRIATARLHPLAILLALRTYAQGKGDRGGLQWEPVQAVIDALNAAFYTAFKAVEPTGKRLLLALDVSGSMATGRVAGSSLTPREASAAMALMTAATEANTHIVGFTGGMVPLPLSPSMRLDDAVQCRVGPAVRSARTARSRCCMRWSRASRSMPSLSTPTARHGPAASTRCRRCGNIARRPASPPSWWWWAWCRTGSASLTPTMPACWMWWASTRPHPP